MAFSHLLVLAQGEQIISPETFTGNNGDSLNSIYWDVQPVSNATVSQSSDSVTIQSNKALESHTATHISGNGSAGFFINSNFFLHGNFSFEVDITYPTGTALNKIAGIQAIPSTTYSSGATTTLIALHGPTTGNQVSWWWPTFGSAAITNATKLRLSRTGSTISAAYFNGSWNTVTTEDKGNIPSIKIQLQPFTYHTDAVPGSGTFSTTYDNVTWTADNVSWNQ